MTSSTENQDASATPRDGGDSLSVSDLSLDALRTSRREAEQEEQEFSYVRRMLHGRIDILRAELRRRAGEGGDLMESLSTILSDAPSGAKPGQGRFVSMDNPSRDRSVARDAESALGEVSGINISSASDRELRESLDALLAHERTVSDMRAQVHRNIDRLSAELTRRYREGTAQVDDLLAAARRT